MAKRSKQERSIIKEHLARSERSHRDNLMESREILKNPNVDDIVTIIIPHNPSDPSSVVPVCINGERFTFDRMKEYQVHKSIKHVLQEAGYLNGVELDMHSKRGRAIMGLEKMASQEG